MSENKRQDGRPRRLADHAPPNDRPVWSRRRLGVAAVAFSLFPGLAAGEGRFIIYKLRTCACCSAWAARMAHAGYQSTIEDVEDLAEVRRRYRVPPDLAACHTAVLSGFVLEGHVPPEDVTRLLSRPPPGALGLAVPGMPVGSPGMETQAGDQESYFTLLLLPGGRRRIFARH